MKHTTLSAFSFACLSVSPLCLYAEETFDPYKNANIPGLDMNQYMKVQEQEAQRQASLKEERSAIIKKIADEELARAKLEAAPGTDPYAVADMRTRERTKTLKAQWKKEDAESRDNVFGKNEADMKKMYGNQNYQEAMREQMEMMKKIGISTPPPNK